MRVGALGLPVVVAARRVRHGVVGGLWNAVAARLERWGVPLVPCAAHRGPPPRCDGIRLEQAYRDRGLDRVPDTYVLYRIIGNDLVPRHARGQSRANVRFILDNEPVLPRCEKRWIVNRIADEAEETAICRLLEAHDQPYIRIPFRIEEYDRMPWDFAGLPRYGWSYRDRDFGVTRAMATGAEYRVYRHRNNYAIHNNGARNAALRDGRERAKWVLPWDGNCFLTASAWEEIRATVEGQPWYPRFVVPMARITANEELLRTGFRPHAGQEPQIAFRSDAREEFDEAHPYGRRPKVELLWRLGVPGPWDRWRIQPWDLPCPPYAADAGCYRWAGWVARLFSGHARLEGGTRVATSRRNRTRAGAVLEHLERLDRQAMRRRFNAGRLLAYAGNDTDTWAASGSTTAPIERAAVASLIEVVDRLMAAGEEATDAGNPDGRAGPGNATGERGAADCPWLLPWRRGVTLGALAWSATGRQQYARHAANILAQVFADDGQARPGGTRNVMASGIHWRRGQPRACLRPDDCIEAVEMYAFLDGVRLLQRAGVLEQAHIHALNTWLTARQRWLSASLHGRWQHQCLDHRGTFHELQRAAIAAWLDDEAVLIDALRNARERLLQQFDARGGQPAEPRGRHNAHYCCLNLQAWVHLATLAGAMGEDLWTWSATDGSRLEAGLRRFLASGDADRSPGAPGPVDPLRLEPLRHAYVRAYAADSAAHPGIDAHQSLCPPLYPHCGVLPGWPLARGPAVTEAATPRARASGDTLPGQSRGLTA